MDPKESDWVYCADCKEYLCTESDQEDHEDDFPRHVTVGEQTSFCNNNNCHQHPGSPLAFYCPRHVIMCCAECKAGLHNKCPLVDLAAINPKKATRGLRRTIKALEKSLTAIKNGTSAALRFGEFEKNITRVRKEITAAFDEARSALNDREQELLDKLDAMHKAASRPENVEALKNMSRAEKALEDGKAFFHTPCARTRKNELLLRMCNAKHEEAALAKIVAAARELPSLEFSYDEDFIEDDIYDFGTFLVTKRPMGEKISLDTVTSDGFTASWPPVISSNDNVVLSYEAELSLANKNKFSVVYTGKKTSCTVCGLQHNKAYDLRLRTLCKKSSVGSSSERKDATMASEWSSPVRVKTTCSWICKWKDCPKSVDSNKRYAVKKLGARSIISKLSDGEWCTAIGDTAIPSSGIVRWGIKLIDESSDNLFVGLAPSDIDQNSSYNYNKCGWYFYCYDSTLWSGLPHVMYHEEYGPRKEDGEYVRTGDSVGIVMDTTKGELSFVLNGVNLGVAYEGIPLDKPLVPCVLLRWEESSVELVLN